MTSAKVKWLIQLSGVLLLDLSVSFIALGLYHNEGFEFYSSTFFDQMRFLRSGFDFCRTGVEFALLAVARLALIVVGIEMLKVCFRIFLSSGRFLETFKNNHKKH